jgi:hypothetical protein
LLFLALYSSLFAVALYCLLTPSGHFAHDGDVLNTQTTQEQRRVVQITLKPSVYQIAKDKAIEHGTHPGRIIEYALLNMPKKRTGLILPTNPVQGV